MRLQPALLAFAIAAGATAAGSAVPAAAAATTPFSLVVTCDEANNQIRTATQGGGLLVGDRQVKATISYVRGTGARTGAIAYEYVASVPPVTVNARTGADGSLPMNGYTRTWPAASYAFYTETAKVEVFNTAGQLILTREGTCTKDTRTTGSLVCDPVANTITANTAGTGYTQREDPTGPAIPSVRVSYYRTRTYQATPDSPAFTSHPGSTPDVAHSVRTTAGAWPDLGYTTQLQPGYWYVADDVDVVVTGPQWGMVIGRAKLHCAMGPGAA